MDISEIVSWSSGGLFLLLSLIQISPIKWNPWSALARCFGNAMNKDIGEKVDKITDRVDVLTTEMNNRVLVITQAVNDLRDECDEREAINARIRILRFNDELIHDVHHTQEHFAQTMEDITRYNRYCIDHPKFRNDMTVSAVDNIHKVYQRCLDERRFL